MPASLAQSDARPTGDQKDAGSIPVGFGNTVHEDISHGHSVPSAGSRRAVVSFWQKNVHKYWFMA